MITRYMQHTLSVLLVCGMFADPLTVQIIAEAIGESGYRVTRWTTDQGLPQNRVSCLAQTQDGYLWVGTWFGVARFDGVRFTVFDKFNTPELVNDAINALAVDSEGTLWIGTADGLLSYRNHHFQRLTSADGLPDEKVWRLARSGSGGIWVQAGKLLTHFKDGEFSPGRALPNNFNNPIRGFQERSDGSLDIMTGLNWLILSAEGVLRTNRIENNSGFVFLTGLSPDKTGGIWVGTQEGLRYWNAPNWKTSAAGPVDRLPVDLLYQDRASNLWAGVRSAGVYHREGTNWTEIDLGAGINPPSPTCILDGVEGSFWLGTDRGLVRVQKRRIRTYGMRDGLPNENVWSVCEGTDGTIWIGTDAGLGRIRNGRVVPLTESDFPWNDSDRCVWPSSDGGVWVGKPSRGIYKFTSVGNRELWAKALPNQHTMAFYEDQSGRLLIGSGEGVAVFADGGTTGVDANPPGAGPSRNDVRCILEDHAGNFWFGTQGQGLERSSHGGFKVFTEEDGLSSNRIWSIYEDAEGALWLGTENGLTRYARGRFSRFRRSEGLLENAVNCVLEDDFGYLWLSGLRGIYRIKREQLNAVADGRIDASTVQVAAFGAADGMESTETNGESQPAGWKARDGRLWFATTAGVVVIDPKTIPSNEPPRVVIERVKADGKTVFGIGAPRLSEGTVFAKTKTVLAPGRAQAIEISYTANLLANPTRARFRYRMIGHDSGWLEETGDRMAHYTNLRPGDYHFEVSAANEQGIWSSPPQSFDFTVAPHFYERWIFYFLSGAGTLALLAALHFWRVRFLHRIERLEQEQLVQLERTRIARDLHDELGSRLTALALRAELGARNSGIMDAQNGKVLALESRALAERMRDVIWAVDPECDSLEAFIAYLTEHADEFSGATGIRLRLELPETLPALPLNTGVRNQLTMFAREALHNVSKHARASEVRIRLECDDGQLRLSMSDDGVGLDPSSAGGRGLGNMRQRVEALGGVFRISSPNSNRAGTTVEAIIPLKGLVAQPANI
jgi:ligand-binding sensor domain-containing protein/signal transduction histidine kinase